MSVRPCIITSKVKQQVMGRGADSIGRVAADRKAGADYAGNSKCCSRGKKLVGVGSEAWAVVGWKSTDETV